MWQNLRPANNIPQADLPPCCSIMHDSRLSRATRTNHYYELNFKMAKVQRVNDEEEYIKGNNSNMNVVVRAIRDTIFLFRLPPTDRPTMSFRATRMKITICMLAGRPLQTMLRQQRLWSDSFLPIIVIKARGITNYYTYLRAYVVLKP